MGGLKLMRPGSVGRYINKGGEVRKYMGRQGGLSIVKQESRVIVETLLNKSLPAKTEVHHIDGNPSNNDLKNLVVCENKKYHNLLHVQTRALKACGHARWRKCTHCKQYDDPKNMYVRVNDTGAYHRQCAAAYYRAKSREKRMVG